MAYSYTPYVGDGSTAIFNVTKPYLLRDHVKLLVDGVEVAFSWLDSARVQADVAPALDSTVWVKRTTPIDVQQVDFQDGSVLGEDDMDASALQSLYIAQETEDNVGSLIQLDVDDSYDVNNKSLKNVADPTNAQDAATKNYVDVQVDPKVTAAQAAQVAAETAQGLAEAAKDAADADVLLTNADAVATAADAVATAADVVSTNADVISADASATAAAVSAANTARVPSRNSIQNQDALSQGTSTRSGMSSTIYTGNGTSQSVNTGVDMATGDFGGLVWLKSRSAVNSHIWQDTVRGIGSQIFSDLTLAEQTQTDRITSFDATGFSLGNNVNVNTNLATYASWNFQTTKKNFSSLGSELITNGTFDTDVTGWIALDGASNLAWHGSGYLEVSNGDASSAAGYQQITTVVGKVYKLNATAISGSSTKGQVFIGTTAGGSEIASSDLTYGVPKELKFVATSTTTFISLYVGTSTNGHDVNFDNITVKEMVGAVPTNRGKAYECHYNLDTNFSIIGYEGDGVDGHEIPHHLGAVPELTICKNRDTSSGWYIKSSLFDPDDYLQFSTAALTNNSATTILPTLNTLSLDGNAAFNGSTNNIISYNFASKSGVCKIGKYIGTGAAGNYVSTEVDGGDGFKPAFVMVKELTSTSEWIIVDSMRGDNGLFAESSSAENPYDYLDFVSDGFALKVGGSNILNSEYLFIAFAETNIDATKAWSDYTYPTTADTLSINENTLVSLANGFNANGEVNNQYQFGAGKTHSLGVGFEDKKLYVYTDKLGNIGTTEVRPLVGLNSRNDADKYGVVSPSDPTLRTTDKHFDYESPSGVVLASGEYAGGLYVAYAAFNKTENDILGSSVNEFLDDVTTGLWVQYKHTEKRILKSYRLRAPSVDARGSQRFTIEGSNDGLNWTEIDATYKTTTGIDYVGNGAYLWGDLEDTSANTTAYLYHRINCGVNRGDATYTGFGEIEFNTVSAADYYLIEEGKMYDSTDVAIERVYLGECITDSTGDVVSYESYAPARQLITDAEVVGGLTVHGDIENLGVCTAWVNFDGTQNPPLIRDSYNVADVVDLGTGDFRVKLINPLDFGAVALGTTGNTGTMGCISYLLDRYTIVVRTLNSAATYADSSTVNVSIFGGKKIKGGKA